MAIEVLATNVIKIVEPGPQGTGGEATITDGDKGDIVVVAGAWTIDPALLSTFMRAFLPVTTELEFKQLMNLEQGVDVQTFDADLSAIAALTSAANKFPYATGAGTWAMGDVTVSARQLLDDANFSSMRTTLGLVPGTDVQTQDADLSAFAGLVSAANKAGYFTGAGTMALVDFLPIAASWPSPPTVIGTSTAGAATYSSQVSFYLKFGNLVLAFAQMIWTAHTGTGNMRVTLPFTNRNIQVPMGNVYLENIAIPAASMVQAVIVASQAYADFYSNPEAGGGATALALDTAGSCYFLAIYATNP
jgi:hypothetical protein